MPGESSLDQAVVPADALPLGFREPRILRVLPGTLRGDGKNGEFRTVVPRLTLLWVGSNEAHDLY